MIIINLKTCKICNNSFPATTEYFYKNKSSKDGLHPYCKKCAINKSSKRQKDNPDRTKAYAKEDYKRKSQYYKDKFNRWVDNNPKRMKELTKEWRQNNPDKLKEYREERLLHKKHDISDEELNELYNYANSSCMYCGMSEEEHREIHNQRLHKDHAINNGSDGIDNCILACKSCNTSKRTNDWDEWYTPDNPKYTEERYMKINQWLNKFH